MLNRAVEEVVTRARIREAGFFATLEGNNGGRAGACDMLVRESHPHRAIGWNAACVRQVVGLGHFSWQAALGKHHAVGCEVEEAPECRRGGKLAVQPINALQPVVNVKKRRKSIAAHSEQQIVSLDGHGYVKPHLLDAAVRARDVRRRWDCFLQGEAVRA